MLDIVFFVWMRSGSYPPDSNECEKTLLLNLDWLVHNSSVQLFQLIIFIILIFVFLLPFSYFHTQFLVYFLLYFLSFVFFKNENILFSRIHSNPVDRNRFSSIRKKLCLASYYIQFSTNIEMYNYKIKTILTSFFSPVVPKAPAKKNQF